MLLRVICQRYLDGEMLGKEWEYWTREPMFSTAQPSSLTDSSMADQGWPRRQFRPIMLPFISLVAMCSKVDVGSRTGGRRAAFPRGDGL